MAVGVLLPAFNEAARIGPVLDRLFATPVGSEAVVVVVDDGSTDGTAAVARAHGARVIELQVNQGKGAAVRIGMEDLRPLNLEAVVWMDADGQHPPESLGALVAPVLCGDSDMVVGSRYLTDSVSKAPWNRRAVRRLTVMSLQRLTGFTITDPYSGFRCFSPAGAGALALCGDRYECELEATFCIGAAGLQMAEVPIERIYGDDMSKMGFQHGRLLGRLHVVSGYARTIGREVVARHARSRVPVHG